MDREGNRVESCSIRQFIYSCRRRSLNFDRAYVDFDIASDEISAMKSVRGSILIL